MTLPGEWRRPRSVEILSPKSSDDLASLIDAERPGGAEWGWRGVGVIDRGDDAVLVHQKTLNDSPSIDVGAHHLAAVVDA